MNTGNYVHTLSIMYKISPSSKLISSGYKRTQDSIKITTNLRDRSFSKTTLFKAVVYGKLSKAFKY